MNKQHSSLCILIDEPESQCVFHSVRLIGYILKNFCIDLDKKALLICTKSSWDSIVRLVGDDIISFFDFKQSYCLSNDNINLDTEYNDWLHYQLRECFGPDVNELRFSNDSYNRTKENNLPNGLINSNHSVFNYKNREKLDYYFNKVESKDDKIDVDNNSDNYNKYNNNDKEKENKKNKANKRSRKHHKFKENDNNKNHVTNDTDGNKDNLSNKYNSSDIMKKLLIRFVDEHPTKKIVDGEFVEYPNEQTFNTFWSYILAANESSIHHDVVDYVIVAGLSEINLRSSASNFDDMNFNAGRLHPFRAVSILEDNTRDYYNKSISMYSLSLSLTLNATKSVLTNKSKQNKMKEYKTNKDNNKDKQDKNKEENSESNDINHTNSSDNIKNTDVSKDSKDHKQSEETNYNENKNDESNNENKVNCNEVLNDENKIIDELNKDDKDKDNNKEYDNIKKNKDNNNHNSDKDIENIDEDNKDNNKLSFPRFILLETLPQHHEDADKFIRFMSQRFTYTYRLN